MSRKLWNVSFENEMQVDIYLIENLKKKFEIDYVYFKMIFVLSPDHFDKRIED